ncbi:GTPase-activating Rap/Ran-GAP domain-like protein 3 [Danio rerio]|uniref:GTPase-activating Rap/Ran-GAP domain-like protein 3 n=1 Tax=Danio rerio TaxID=7955 RepID=GARL3_DANRE|nr:GTPase-activating Rap/Ran-GAP domain-like protein 3 [Danio rerio]A5PF44.1 RecName: Full=GTPase-activating Rap/Ran-GAP domain-like protein 3 [Danio rerio]CAN88087.1 novel protein similar to vertebrate GTPase activating Rap/RanGAP domain-like 3 (GARNL3) [Danio rerio]CAN88090.1 novel protein similar to vertebrate GTPase activating Rap/RanGAP domain-like 3 (GARNL3) [Danio rerio]|eukprot:NP_001121999.1 GTPase-activating Rap/Ran-GAP domain-like protein 3 [Danio rerio]
MNSDINMYLGREKAGIMRKRALLLRKGCSFEITSSASEDLGCRRGEFSRKHYGSVELLISSDADGAIQRAGRFRVENGSIDEISDYTPGTWRRTDVHLENPEYHTRWYFKYFLGKVHQNYVGTDAEKNPFFLSVVLSDQNNQRVPQYRAILWRKTGTLKISLPYSPTKTLSVKSILSAMNVDRFEKGPREILNPEIQKDLLVLEEQEGSVNFKFGVLYAKDGQLTDDEMFSNEMGSETFEKFLNLLGDTICLQGWAGYRGGLDTKNDTTGINSIYTVYQGHELMFHVSTMLPYSKENKQQVERKRHIGNDIVTIVFQEGDDASPSFKPSMIRSHFTHIFALVRYNSQNDSYRLKIFSEESVPLFGPPLPSPPVFTDHQEFRDFLLVKLINGEKATLETPTFAQKRQRTLDMLIRSLYQDLMPDMHKNMLNRRSFSDVLPESPKSARKKEEARQAEFVRVGQALKLKTIVRGDAPTSLVTTGLCRKEPWESQSFCSSFPYDIVCGDSWGQSLLVATDSAGVMLLEDSPTLPPVQVFDKTLTVKQMHVLEPQDLLIARADKGKDARLYVYRLSTLKQGIEERQLVRTKCDSRENKLEKTKGCHLYSINTHHGVELRIVAAIRNKLLLITRKQSRLECVSSIATVTGSTDSPVEEFQYIREICLCDSPVVMALVDGPTGENDHMICVAYRHQFDLINESTGDAYRLHHVDSNRVNFVAAIDVYEDGEAGLLLCYNNICVYKKVCPFNGATPMIQPNTSDFHFSWNQMPNATVCAFPYILAFTTDSIEIRLVVNGNLVYTAVVPELQLTASRSDIYFISSAPINSASNCSSRDTSSQSSPQTPTGYEMPVFPSPLGDGETQSKHIYKIPLSNLVGRSIERPLKSPLVNKVLTAPAPSMTGPAPMIGSTTSLSLSRMEIKEIASRTRKELLGLTEEPSSKADGNSVKQRRMSKKNKEEEQKRTAEISIAEQVGMESVDGETDIQQLCPSGSEVEVRDDSPPTANPFTFSTSFEDDILDLK